MEGQFQGKCHSHEIVN